MTRALAIVSFLFGLCSPWVMAHPLDLGFIQIQKNTSSKIAVSFELNPKAAERFSHLKEAIVSQQVATKYEASVFDATLRGGRLLINGKLCSWGTALAEYKNDQQIRISSEVDCSESNVKKIQTISLALPFLRDAPSTYQVLGKVELADGEHTFLIEPKHLSVAITSEPALMLRFSQFVWMGIEHIGAAPSQWQSGQGLHLPDGIDHILFLVALILTGGNFFQMLKTATGFTLGHSVTLALASLRLIHLSPRLIESAIALSIVYVAFEDLFIKRPKHRWQIATLFGLVHGFGFATALGELHLEQAQMLEALVGFNIGVEAGQALIIAILLPLVWLLRMRPAIRKIAIPSSAFGIGVTASYWFIVRAFG